MKYLSSAAASLFIILLVSCDSKPEDKDPLLAPSVSSTTTNPILPGNNDSLAASDAGVALNPKHGEPGHRCDIAVGAPLNTQPATSTIQPAASTIQPASSTIQPNVPTTIPPLTASTPTSTISTVSTEAKKPTTNLKTVTTALNPKHGEPGHRCDLAVGAPLNTKPQ